MHNFKTIEETELAQIGGNSALGYVLGWLSRACYDGTLNAMKSHHPVNP